MIHRSLFTAAGLLVGALALGGCFVESQPRPVAYSPGYYNYTTQAQPGLAYYGGGYYSGTYYQPGYYHPRAPFFSGGVATGAPTVYGAPAVQGTVVGGGYQQYPQQQQQYYRPQQNYGGAYVGGGGGVATPVGSVNGAVRMGVPIP